MEAQRSIVASTGKHGFTLVGNFLMGVLIRFPAHPDGLNYSVSVTQGSQTANVFVSYNPNSDAEAAVFARANHGSSNATDFCFVIH